MTYIFYEGNAAENKYFGKIEMVWFDYANLFSSEQWLWLIIDYRAAMSVSAASVQSLFEILTDNRRAAVVLEQSFSNGGGGRGTRK